MTKEELVKQIDSLKAAVETENVAEIIGLMTSMRIDAARSPLCDFAKDIIINDVKDYVSKHDKLKVDRKGVYGEITSDTYMMKDDVLVRNGTNVRFSSLGKIYQAYKKIHKITD